jgi:hypothetical protein
VCSLVPLQTGRLTGSSRFVGPRSPSIVGQVGDAYGRSRISVEAIRYQLENRCEHAVGAYLMVHPAERLQFADLL